MDVTNEGIVFHDIYSLETFYYQFDLNGVLRFEEDLQDNNGGLLLKGGHPLSPEMIDKLKELRGSYKESFSVLFNADLRKPVVHYLAGFAVEKIDSWPLMRRLYDIPGHRFRKYIERALSNDKTAFAALALMLRNQEQLETVMMHGLLTLAVVMHGFFRIKMLHADAFLAGVIFGMADPEGFLSAPSDEVNLERQKNDALKLCSELEAPQSVVDAIRRQRSCESIVEDISDSLIDASSETNVKMEEFLEMEGRRSRNEEMAGEAATYIISEAMHFCRYILYLRARLKPEEHLAREIATRVAYNAGKGFFSMKLASPLLQVFNEYEKEIRTMMRVAQLELKCLYLPSAWAYPKQRPTQMICRQHVLACPNLKAGWNLTVVSSMEAYGWIGTSLSPGRYLKCQLEEEFKDIYDLP